MNLLPWKGKICNFDCIYCEVGWNKDGLADSKMPDAEEVHAALEAKLHRCLEDGTVLDSITFSGDGEPTLNPDFPKIVRDTIALRDRYFPKVAVSVLSNATRLNRDEIFGALRMVDNPILKLDAPTDELAARINQPNFKYSVSEVVKSLERFEGDFILQTMFLRSENFDSSSPEVLLPWMDIVRRLRPREVMIYSLARPTPASNLVKFSAAQMRELVQPLINEGFKIKINE